jgi:hypothetical protein
MAMGLELTLVIRVKDMGVVEDLIDDIESNGLYLDIVEMEVEEV